MISKNQISFHKWKKTVARCGFVPGHEFKGCGKTYGLYQGTTLVGP
jgi:hypothetical protein